MQIQLNKSASRYIQIGLNPWFDFSHEIRLYKPQTGSWFSITKNELDQFFGRFLNNKSWPIKLSSTLFMHQVKNEIFVFQREASNGKIECKMFIGLRSLQRLQELESVITAYYKTLSPFGARGIIMNDSATLYDWGKFSYDTTIKDILNVCMSKESIYGFEGVKIRLDLIGNFQKFYISEMIKLVHNRY